MKKLFLLLNLFVCLMFRGEIARAQLVSLDSIGYWPDSVFDNDAFPLEIYFSNSGGVFFSADIAVIIQTGADTSTQDTLFYDSLYVLSGNTLIDSISVTHTFSSEDLDAGDNIVVVWPASSQLPIAITGDTLSLHVFLKNVGIEENERNQSLQLFPNPARDLLRLLIAFPEKVEQVRVFDVLGTEVMYFNEPVTSFSTESLSGGVYFVEVRNKDRSMVVRKFLRE